MIMAQKKATGRTGPGRSRGIGAASKARAGGPRVAGAGREPELTEVDREVIGALSGFRDALRDRIPLETRYTVRQVVSVAPPPPMAPAEVREIRESLGLSQPVFADCLGTSHSTLRSWEQGQKPPSPMARRFLGLIAADRPYWMSRFRSMMRTRGGEPGEVDGPAVSPVAAGDRPGEVGDPRHRAAVGKKGAANKPGPETQD
jgi:DNA-binding transcriptional regulator YiaG